MPPAPETLLRLHTAYAPGVYRFLWTLTRDREVAQDLLQEVFAKLARDASGLTAAVSEQAWIFRMGRNAALDWLRRSKVRDRAALHLADFAEAFVLPEDPDAAALERRMAGALALLPEEQRAAVHLHLWEGLTFREVAEIQEVPLPTVTSRYRYGITALRAALQPLYSELYES
jgi:RNA polymerase sigma-70 factor (ECF subfamily)